MKRRCVSLLAALLVSFIAGHLPHADAQDKPGKDTTAASKTPPPESAANANRPPANWPQGIPPTGPEGNRLNLDFETGDLRDWVATGTAFDGQPIEGDTVHRRRSDMHSEHLGRFWIGTFERAGDQPQGTLTSATIRVTHPWASFLVGGGDHESTRVEVVRRDTDEVVFKASGQNRENMRPVVVDLRKYVGKDVFVRLVDEHSGHWGHVNFDEFRFHDKRPTFPNAAAEASQPAFAYAGLPAEEAARRMTLPEGFKATVFAAEPDVRQPIALALDDRGRVWIAEAYSYPFKRPADQARDRILIFEDTDGDGHFDKRTVFFEGLNLVSGLEVGFGGVWVGQAPELLFIPDKNHDDVPDGKPVTLLDGFAYQDTHETLNAFMWGPDGWLYGCHGVFTHSRVGKPGTPDEQRIPINAGVWRYHPTQHVFEVFAHGTSNPWGIDFDDHGQAFITACVIPHLYHVIQGGRYQRQAGRHFNPYTYDDIKTIADHLHYTGDIREHAHWGHTPQPPQSTLAAGGGHAHAGAMIYLGDAWPKQYRGKLFMNNIHGARVNMDVPEPHGSGFVGRHGPDFLLANDLWSQILNFRYGPDGQVYLIDWYDANQCHRPDDSKHDRSNGRIYKISYVGPRQSEPERQRRRTAEPASTKNVDLQKLSDAELVELQLRRNDYYVRHARRILQERAAAGTLDASIHKRLAEIALEHPDETRRLRALWTLHVTGGLTEPVIQKALHNDSAYVRAWTVQLALEDIHWLPRSSVGTVQRSHAERGNESVSAETLAVFADLAKHDPSPVVRLYLASALQRLPHEDRWDILPGLLSHPEDVDDHNLPLMDWYALEPLVPDNMHAALALAQNAQVPLVRSFTLRRIAAIGSQQAVGLLVQALGELSNPEEQHRYVTAIREALKGRRQFPKPDVWPPVAETLARSNDPTVRDEARALGVTFGDASALSETRRMLTDSRTDLDRRKAALSSLLAVKDPQLPSVLFGLVRQDSLRSEALRGLAAYADPQTPEIILANYSHFGPQQKRDALNTLASRTEYADALLTAIDKKKVPPADLSADIIRQLRNLNDESILKKVNDVWGIVRETAADKKKLIAEYQKLVTGPGLKPDVALGRAVFAQTCQQCHKLFGTGASVGPDLTGSNRRDVDYLLSNVLDPSAVMAKEYQPSVIVTDDGRTLTGIIQEQNENAVTVVTANETVVVPKSEIEILKPTDKSMMPDNLWQQLKPHEVRSLVAYVGGNEQVPMLATAETAKTFFNGRDLTGWRGNTDLWSVENSEIVGTSPGIDHNEFLKSELLVEDFELSLQVKLVPNTGNSGIQFRSVALDDGEMRGYQADVGAGWWGKLYEERGRGLLWKKPGDEFVKQEQWNDYRIQAKGNHVRTWLNGHLCVNLEDPQGAHRGIIALQIHAGPAMQVRFRNIKLTVPDGSGAANPTVSGK